MGKLETGAAAVLLLGVILIPFISKADEPPPPPDGSSLEDFRRAIDLTVEGNDPLYVVDVPEAVYRGVANPELADVRVFNAEGFAVPYAVRRPVAEAAASVEYAEAPLFPFAAPADAGAGTASFSARTRDDGSIIELAARVETASPGGAEAGPAGYVLDLSRIAGAVSGLSFSWPGDETVSFRVDVDASDELANWTRLSTGAVLARYAAGGRVLERAELAFAPVRAKYARVSFADPRDAVKFSAVKARIRDVSFTEAEVSVARAQGSSVDGGGFVFDTGGRFPVHDVRIELPQPNTILETSLWTADDPKGLWGLAAEPLLYRLSADDSEIVSPEIPVWSSRRYWKLSLKPGGGLGSGEPVLVYRWRPHRVVFAAQGKGPFTLVYGNSGVAPAEIPLETLLAMVDKKLSTLKRAIPAAAERVLGAGSDARRAAAAAAEAQRARVKKGVLWGSLVAGVGVLALVARSLMKEMR